MKVIIFVFLLLMALYISWAPSVVVFFMHIIFCIFVVLYIAYKTKTTIKNKVLKIISTIVITSTIVYNADYIATSIYLKIYKPEEEISLFLTNKEYEKQNSKYEYFIEEGLSYQDFENYEYIRTIPHITHYIPYFTTSYKVIYKNKDNEEIYIVMWQRKNKNNTFLLFSTQYIQNRLVRGN